MHIYTPPIYIYIYQERQCTDKRNTEARSQNGFYRGKAVSIAYSSACLY